MADPIALNGGSLPLKLVGGLEHFLFFYILGIIIPTDQYFSEGLKPPTRKFGMLTDVEWYGNGSKPMMFPDERGDRRMVQLF